MDRRSFLKTGAVAGAAGVVVTGCGTAPAPITQSVSCKAPYAHANAGRKLLYPLSPEERAEGLAAESLNLSFPPGDIRRYYQAT